ncbi:hypothetical protein GCM10019016_126570 [Streptomyces prasinosporus]|uniref:Uncharacterized protein n=1 Tax=Streptomyces prasinosporus TaxID=68256 RepID=A0ABP6UDL9_9ACTN
MVSDDHQVPVGGDPGRRGGEDLASHRCGESASRVTRCSTERESRSGRVTFDGAREVAAALRCGGSDPEYEKHHGCDLGGRALEAGFLKGA